jgi:methyl-accepting chemotaxis protein
MQLNIKQRGRYRRFFLTDCCHSQQETLPSQQIYAVEGTATTIDELGESSRACALQAEAADFGAKQAIALTAGGSQALDNTLKEMVTLTQIALF